MRFSPDEVVLLRDILDERVFTARPVRVVEDDGRVTALALTEGTEVATPDFGGRENAVASLAAGSWTVKTRRWTHADVLIVLREDTPYAPHLFRSTNGTSDFWYLNLQDPPVRTDDGFETMDRILDIVAAPDLSSWRWKDEHELEEALRIGLLTEVEAATIRSHGDEAAAEIESGDAWWADWSDWHPSPDAPAFELPHDWHVR